jgi:hypothetical protein
MIMFFITGLLLWALDLEEPSIPLKQGKPNAYNVLMLALVMSWNLIILAFVQHEGVVAANFYISVFTVLAACCPIVVNRIQKPLDDIISTTCTSSSIYSNFSRAGSEVFFTAIAQGILQSLYAVQASDVKLEKFNYVYWLLTVFSFQIWLFSSLPPQMGKFYMDTVDTDLTWRVLQRHPIMQLRFDSEKDDGNQRVFVVSRMRIRVQWFLTLSYNCVGFMYICNTVPLLLSQSTSPLEYVMNCFALTFITTLDDLDEVTFSALDGQDGLSVAEHIPIKAAISSSGQ